jgi:Zn-dependent oligopeptidase
MKPTIQRLILACACVLPMWAATAAHTNTYTKASHATKALPSARVLTGDFPEYCKTELAKIDAKLASIKRYQGEKTIETVLTPLNEVLIDIDFLWNHSVLFTYTHPDETTRNKAGECYSKGGDVWSFHMGDNAKVNLTGELDAKFTNQEQSTLTAEKV